MKKEFSSTDAAPHVIYGKTDPSSENVIPIIVVSDGTLVVSSSFESNQQGIWDYSGGTLVIYDGYASRGVPTNSTGWILRKFSYDGSGNIIQRQIAYDSWVNRGTASYA